MLWRKELIERKVARKKAGGRLGNLFHHPQSELSEAEVKRRLDWILKMERDERAGPCRS